MDTNENQEWNPIADQESDQEQMQQDVQAEEVQTPEEAAQLPQSGTYRGAGAGQKESPFANSPYYSYAELHENESQLESAAEEIPVQEEPAPVRRTPVKKGKTSIGKVGKGIVAAIAALAVVAGSCAITAGMVNERWEGKLEKLEDRFEDQLEDLQEQIDRVDDDNTVVSGGVAYEGMTPSQVYARSVDAVVGVTGYVNAGNRFGQSAGLTAYSTGSGFFISADGYAVTNYHVVEGTDAVKVTTHGGDVYDAELVGYDEINDVAVLKVEATDLEFAELGSSAQLDVGDMVVVIGNPLGELTATQTVGYVSGKDRSVATDGTAINMLQTDAAINSGNSGGPVFNMEGQVIGIATAKYSGSTSSGASIEGIGFAIPIDDVATLIDDLVNFGYNASQAYLGVLVKELDSTTAQYYSLPIGAYVQSVEEGGSAERAGVEPGDIILAIGEHEVSGLGTLQIALRKFTAGQTSTITVYRGGQEITMDITFDQRPADAESGTVQEPEAGEMPDTGDYQEWYDYFFGDGRD